MNIVLIPQPKLCPLHSTLVNYGNSWCFCFKHSQMGSLRHGWRYNVLRPAQVEKGHCDTPENHQATFSSWEFSPAPDCQSHGVTGGRWDTPKLSWQTLQSQDACQRWQLKIPSRKVCWTKRTSEWFFLPIHLFILHWFSKRIETAQNKKRRINKTTI